MNNKIDELAKIRDVLVEKCCNDRHVIREIKENLKISSFELSNVTKAAYEEREILISKILDGKPGGFEVAQAYRLDSDLVDQVKGPLLERNTYDEKYAPTDENEEDYIYFLDLIHEEFDEYVKGRILIQILPNFHKYGVLSHKKPPMPTHLKLRKKVSK